MKKIKIGKIKIGSKIKFSLKQKKPFSGKGKITKIYPNWYEINVYPYMVGLDEVVSIS